MSAPVACGQCKAALDERSDLPPNAPVPGRIVLSVQYRATSEVTPFEDRHASTQAYIEYMGPRRVELAQVLRAVRFDP